MNQSQALRAVELIGGYRKTANMVKNLNGEPMHEGNLKKAIKRTELVPDWLGEQLEQALYKHMINCSKVLHEIEDQQQ